MLAEGNRLTREEQMQAEIDEVRQEYIDYMTATGGRDKENADRILEDAIRKVKVRYQ